MKDEILEVLEEDAVDTRDEPVEQMLDAPPYVNIPSPLIRGVPFNVSWNDIGGATFYNVYQQIYGGQTIFSTNTNTASAQMVIPTDTTFQSVRYGVTAQNPYAVSAITYSIFTSVQDPPNQPPTTPPSITVPTIYFNTSFQVSWELSVDPDGHTITYYLERSLDGAAWTPMQSGSTNNWFFDTLGIASSRVAYRVRAKDQLGAYSSWKTSEIRHITNRIPGPIASITAPTAIRSGQPFDISWSQSVDPDGHAVTYYLERAINGSSTYSVVYSGLARREVQDTITGETSTSVRYRVKGVDALGAGSVWTLSLWIPVTHDKPPTISGYDRDIGTMTQGFTYDYTATDPAGHDVALVEYINNTPIRGLTVRSGTQQTFSVLGNIFSLLPNGRNTIKIAAASTIGIIANRVITFTKEPDRISATYTEPEKCRIRPKRINILPRGNFPAGAIYKAYATNNGLDEAPIWEDCTQAVNSRVAHVFQNKRKRSTYWGVNFRLEIFRDHAIEKDICTLNGISIQWE